MRNKALLPGTTLKGGKYRIESVLGHGTFGITYLASCSVTVEGELGQMSANINVAVKEFFMSEINNRNEGSNAVEGSTGELFTNYCYKFRREAENMAKLRHEGIVQVSDVFDENNTTYYVMQYIDGGSLDSYIIKKGRLAESEVVRLTSEIGDALHYLHSKRMLHLDLKPSNVMLDKNGHAHLIDFGLSKQYDATGNPESSTSVGAGTPGYAPIEQTTHNDSTFQPTIDIYAIGATMFKMLTGQRPPEASDILNEGFPRSLLLQNGVSPYLATIVEKAMSPQRNNRYADIEDMLTAIGDKSNIIADIDDDPTSFHAPVYGPPPFHENRQRIAPTPTVYGPPPVSENEENSKRPNENENDEDDKDDENNGENNVYKKIIAVIAIAIVIMLLLVFVSIFSELTH